MRSAQDIVERCLIHWWFPELEPSKRRDVAASILDSLAAAGYMKSVEGG